MDIDDAEWRAQRSYLLAVAYRLLGSLSDAEDAVQEAYLRLVRTDPAGIINTRAWLVTALSRICLDQMKSARVRRESYVGPWLPEPLVGTDAYGVVGAGTAIDPADRVALAESVQMALLVVLETLSPAERTAFVLHDVFGMSFDDIADALGRSAASARQLASRARRHVRERTPRHTIDNREAAEVADAFAAAADHGDAEQLLRLLDPEVVVRSDGGGKVFAARRPVEGAPAVTQLLLGLRRRYADVTLHRAAVNAGQGFVFEQAREVLAVAALTVADGRVCAIDLVLNPDKLRNVRLPIA